AILYGHKRGDSYQKIADIVQCGKTTIHDAIKRFKETGSAISKKRCDPKSLFNSNAQSSLKKIVIQIRSIVALPLKKFKNYGLKKKKFQLLQFVRFLKKSAYVHVLSALNH
ncbi:10341_t:CDS:1, partial [Funneliformis geosporum]